jgi:NitT/TauT family transport system substrate-binding protein
VRVLDVKKWLAASALIFTVSSPDLTNPAAAADKIKFALPGNSMGYLPLFVAVHRGFFKDEGIDIELPRLVPAMAQNALLAGEVQDHGLADSGLRLAARGAPIKAIFYGADRPCTIWWPKDITRSPS